jgi:metalloendopeptidase OMA1, mitochondrial
MKRQLGLLPALLVLAGCATVPYTNRRQMSWVPEGTEMSLGDEAYADVKKKSKVSHDPALQAQVDRVGRRIAQVADKPEYKWEFVVIDDAKTVNAFCLPGGKVAVYTGILPLTQDDNGLAVVLSHEVSHALARHGAERMSEQMLIGSLEQVAVTTGFIKNDQQLSIVEQAYGIGRGLPHSRAQESEADHIGLILMAKAGYDPKTAVPFWERMQKASKGGGPPEFLSDHPSDAKRIDKIKEELPEAMQYFRP